MDVQNVGHSRRLRRLARIPHLSQTLHAVVPCWTRHSRPGHA